MNELQFFLEKRVTGVEFDNTKLAKTNWKISKTPIGNPSGDIVSSKSITKKINFFLKKHNI
jgi:hypothetical protein